MFIPDPLSSSSPWVERMPSSMACFTPMTTRQSRTLLLLTARSVPGDRGLRNLLRMLQVPRPRFLVHILHSHRGYLMAHMANLASSS